METYFNFLFVKIKFTNRSDTFISALVLKLMACNSYKQTFRVCIHKGLFKFELLVYSSTAFNNKKRKNPKFMLVKRLI